ncbi:MAG: NOL1/NOP2/sun family putative RNA methylase [Candidatus Aenigmatarchaeota archaeon]
MRSALQTYLSQLPNFDYKRYEQTTKFSFPKSIRVNTLKVCREELVERLESQGWSLEHVPWCADGFFTDRLLMGDTPEHVLGYYFIQDAASMAITLALDPQPGDAVLDISAAPGAKTTHIAQLMGMQGAIVANDTSFDRVKALAANIQRCGVANAVITQADGRAFPRWAADAFDRVLVDAPCSGLGQIRAFKEIEAKWTERAVHRLAAVQKGLMLAGFDCLKPGGTLVYSTCTLAPDENEAVVQHLLDKRPTAKIEAIRIEKIKVHEGLTEWHSASFVADIRKCIRIYPYDNGTEGFFVAKVVKR